jgi:bifunctional DNase/RNase
MIYLDRDGETIAIDARPSDAIALALRTRSPIFVEDSVVESAKGLDLSKEATDSERLQKWLEGLNPDDLGKYKM